MPKPIVAYFRSGNRSGMAVSILKQSGTNDALVFSRGNKEIKNTAADETL